ncbi:MAG TPA: phosphotransferase [Dehalococcoidia bacterium]
MAKNAPTTDIDPVHVLAEAGYAPPAAITQIEGGWITLIWRFQTADGRTLGLRLYRPADGIDEQARREKLTIDALRAAGLPAPAIEKAGTYDGCPYFVMEWLPGRPLIDDLEKKLWRLWSLASEFGRLQARIHRLQPRELAYENRAWADYSVDDDVAAAVKTNARDESLCHFDYHPLNVLSNGSGITGLIDFSQSGLADRRADLGRTQALLAAAPIPPGPIKPVLQVLRKQFALFWRRGYKAEAGDFPIEPLYEAWGAASFIRDIEEAVADGRGWGTPEDVARIHAYLADRKRAAGL